MNKDGEQSLELVLKPLLKDICLTYFHSLLLKLHSSRRLWPLLNTVCRGFHAPGLISLGYEPQWINGVWAMLGAQSIDSLFDDSLFDDSSKSPSPINQRERK